MSASVLFAVTASIIVAHNLSPNHRLILAVAYLLLAVGLMVFGVKT